MFFFFDEDQNETELIPVDQLELTREEAEAYNSSVRMLWHDGDEKWYFSIIDVVKVLTDSKDPTAYWRKLKQRLKADGNETVTNCHGLKMPSADGKMRLTDVADTEQLLRLVQSIPSPKAEPFKQWLAKVGAERLDEEADPEISIDRAIQVYRKKGYSEKWISQRLRTIDIRKELTAEWQRSGASSNSDYAVLTNILTKSWSGLDVKQYKKLKGLKKENLRDNMTNTELALNLLAEVSTTELSRARNPQTMQENVHIAAEGGSIAGNARKELEERLGKKVISTENSLGDKNLLDK